METIIMNKYLCMYNRISIEIDAETSYEAQKISHEHFQKTNKPKIVKDYNIITILLEKDGQPIVHDTSILGS